MLLIRLECLRPPEKSLVPESTSMNKAFLWSFGDQILLFICFHPIIYCSIYYLWTITKCCIIQMFVNLMSKASTKRYLSFYSGSWNRRRKTDNSPHSKLTCRLHGDLTSKPSRLINHGHAALTAAVAWQPGCKNRGEAER